MIAIAPTDLEWFRFLKSDLSVTMINFWTPTPWNIKRLEKGDKFYFLLKSPIRKIGGYGYFDHYINMSIKDAWIQFGKANGVKSYTNLAERCSNYVKKNSHILSPLYEASEIGCIILNDPVFFEEEDYFTPDKYGFDFATQVVKLKYFDKDFPSKYLEGEKNNFSILLEEETQYTSSRIKHRIGQNKFRNSILKAYDFKCAVTGETCIEVLQAAHIQPYINEHSNNVQNGLCLRIDIHKLFDEGLISIDENYILTISPILAKSNYSELNGIQIRLPNNINDHPSIEALKYHKNSLFRG